MLHLSRMLMTLAVLVGTACLAMAQKSPEETVKSMTVADGLQVELFAAEPMVINPTSIDVDHLGRVWVCEAVNYRRKMFNKPMNREAGDRIVILTDKDGDGKADESTVFYQGQDLYGPIGIAVAKEAKGPGYKVFVCQSPDILLFEDKDGDGKADGPPKKFLTGFGGFDHDHGVHGINIGPDGRLYFTVGDQGLKGLQASDGKGRKWVSNNSDCQGGTVWRCNMDGTNLELIAHNFRNNYECCVNSFGEIWLSDNDDDGNQQTRICQVMPGGNYGYFPRGPGQSHWHEEQPGIVHKTMRTGFGSPTGICFYEGTLLPKKYQGQLLHTDAGPRELRCFHIKPKGAGYELEKENLVTSTDNWFRLSDVCVAPDGSLMLADWYDPGVGGHGMGDWTRGRIYRVTPKGHKGYKVPEVDLRNRKGVIDALASPAIATRSLAISTLQSQESKQLEEMLSIDLFAKDVEKGLSNPLILTARLAWRYADESVRDQRYTLSFLGILDAFGEDERARAISLYLRASQPMYKAHGQMPVIQVDDDRTLGKIARIFAKGKNPGWSSLREVLTLLRDESVASMKPAFYELASLYDGQDIFYRAALNIACGTDPARRDAILADFDKHFPEWNDKVADLVWELRPKSVLPRLGKLLEDSKLTAAQKGRIVDILAVNDDAEAGKTLISLLSRDVPAEAKTRALDNLRLFLATKWKGLSNSPELKTAIDGLLKDDKTRATGLQLIAAAGATDRAQAVGSLAREKGTAEALRKEAITTLSKLRSAESVMALGTLMTERGDPLAPQAAAALGALIGQGNDPISKSALEYLQRKLTKNDGEPAPLLQAILSSLAGSRVGTQWLLKEKEEGRLRAELVSDTGRLLRNSPFQGERNKALILFPTGGKLDPKKLPAPAELAKRSGDVARGEKVFAASFKGETQCMRCHMVRGTGGQIGPDLSMIGKKASKENLYDSLLTPSKAIADQYLQWKVATADGKSISGLLVEETKEALTLRDANGKDYRIPTADIDSKQKSLVSLMPDNLIASFTEEELVDVVEYLFSLKTPSLTPDSWNILGPFANDESDSGLDKDLGLEAKKSIDLTETLVGKDSQVSWKKVKVDGAGYIDLTAHHGDKAASSASYLYRVIESPIDQKGTILFGNDDGAKVWVNGMQLFENRDHFAATPGRHKIPITLKKGPNPILIKIVNGNNPHGFYFTLNSDEELKAGK